MTVFSKQKHEVRYSTPSVWRKAYFFGFLFCIFVRVGFVIKEFIGYWPNESVIFFVWFFFFYAVYFAIAIWVGVVMYNNTWKIKKEEHGN